MVGGQDSTLDMRTGDIADHVTRLSTPAHDAPGHVMVPDAELLLSAKYSKQGADLILTGSDGQKFVVADYFNHDKHADLMAPGGAMLSADTVDKLTVSDAAGQYAQIGAPAGAAAIGHVERLGGSATVQHANGTVEELHVGDKLMQGDVVATNDGSQIGLSFSDGTAFNMGADARMVLSELIYDANSSSNASIFSLVKGSISFVAGRVAKTGDMKVETPVATMGIRGTSVNTNVSTDVNGNIVSVTYSLMADPDGHVGSFNILDRTTGAIIGTVATTDTSFVVTPSANLGIVAMQVGKTPEQIAQELSVAQALFPIFLANPANFDQQNLNVNPQGQPTKSGSVGSSEVFAGGSQTPLDNGSHNGTGPNQNNNPADTHTTTDPVTGNTTTDVILHSNASPSIFADVSPAHLVEAARTGHGPVNPGTPTSVAHLFVTDIDGTATYNTAALLAAGWLLVSVGIYAKAGTYGTATLNTGTNTVTYALDNHAADPLNMSDHPAEVFNIPVIDNQGATASTNVVFTVDGADDAPKFDGGALAYYNVAENTSYVTFIRADDVDHDTTLTYSIVNGLFSPDAAKFSIDSHGNLSFNTPPDYENPTDPFHHNLYTVQVEVSDGTYSDFQTVFVHVTNQNEAPHAAPDRVVTNTASGHAFQIPEWALMANDSDPDGDSLDITHITSSSGFSHIDLWSHHDSVTVTDNFFGGGSFDYRLSDGSLSDIGHVAVTHDTGTMYGTSASEIFIGDSSGATINAGGGDDILIGNHGNDTLNGGSGNDTYGFGLSDGHDTINDSSGHDTIRIDTGGAELTGLNFAEGHSDDLVIKFDNQQITVDNHFLGGHDVESLTFVGGANGGSFAGYDLGGTYNLSNDSGYYRTGTSGNDILSGDSHGNNLNGGAGNDLLFGNSGNDTLIGGTGNDLLAGGGGNDLLVGGGGADTFVFAPNLGHDTIADFQVGHDTISFDASLFSCVADILAHTTDVCGSAVVTLDCNNSITFHDVTKEALQAHQSDFHLIA